LIIGLDLSDGIANPIGQKPGTLHELPPTRANQIEAAGKPAYESPAPVLMDLANRKTVSLADRVIRTPVGLIPICVGPIGEAPLRQALHLDW
jgi:hypothetical protein